MMRYERMLWNGYAEICALAERWNLGEEFHRELANFAKAMYNSGANDALEHLESITTGEIERRGPGYIARPLFV